MSQVQNGSIPEPKYSLWEEIVSEGIPFLVTGVFWEDIDPGYRYVFTAKNLVGTPISAEVPPPNRVGNVTLEEYATIGLQGVEWQESDFAIPELAAFLFRVIGGYYECLYQYEGRKDLGDKDSPVSKIYQKMDMARFFPSSSDPTEV